MNLNSDSLWIAIANMMARVKHLVIDTKRTAWSSSQGKKLLWPQFNNFFQPGIYSLKRKNRQVGKACAVVLQITLVFTT